MLKLFTKGFVVSALVLVGIVVHAPLAMAAKVYVGGDAAKVGIVDQHPLARGENLYDTQPNASGIYNRTLDVDTVDPVRRYDALPEYYNDTDAAKLKLSLINGAWYCAPTSALSLVKYWANDPRFPNLFNPGQGDTNRSVLLQIANLMDTDDLANKGGDDAKEQHLGTRFGDIRPALVDYFNARYPNIFTVGERFLGQPDVTINNLGYDTAVNRNIPTILTLNGHMVVGIGYDSDFGRLDPRHYLINDPWAASANIGLNAVGHGRFLPRGAQGVYGASFAEDLYGPDAAQYDETAWGLSEEALPDAMFWVLPIDEEPLTFEDQTTAVPEPSSLLLMTSGLLGFLYFRKPQCPPKFLIS